MNLTVIESDVFKAMNAKHLKHAVLSANNMQDHRFDVVVQYKREKQGYSFIITDMIGNKKISQVFSSLKESQRVALSLIQAAKIADPLPERIPCTGTQSCLLLFALVFSYLKCSII